MILTCLFSGRARRLLCGLMFVWGIIPLSSCVHRPGLFRVAGIQSLRINSLETYAVSVVSESKGAPAFDPKRIESLLCDALQRRGIRLVARQSATRILTLKCRDVARPPRNEPPLAPGTRLWYQRRIFAPTASRSSSGGSLRLEVILVPAQSLGEDVQPKELRATMFLSDKSPDGLGRAVDFLLDAIQDRPRSAPGLI
jgi:hypothetical protein